MACDNSNCHNGCGAGCSSSCSGDCKGTAVSCSECNSNCSGKCKGSCQGSCDGDCRGSCSAGASGTGCNTNVCGIDCTGKCSSCNTNNSFGWGSDDGGCSGCSGTCKDTCEKACDTGCYTEAALDLYNKLAAGLDRKILAQDMQNINDMIQLEAKRRSLSAISQSFNAKERATPTKVKALQSTLKTIGFETSKEGNSKDKIMKNLGTELIDKTLKAYRTEIKHK